jgi:hypothetical protein
MVSWVPGTCRWRGAGSVKPGRPRIASGGFCGFGGSVRRPSESVATVSCAERPNSYVGTCDMPTQHIIGGAPRERASEPPPSFRPTSGTPAP